MVAPPPAHPGHRLMVTPGAVRVFVDCSCGYTTPQPNKRAANRVALRHHHDVGGCNCPPEVVALDVHPNSSGPGHPGSAAAVS